MIFHPEVASRDCQMCQRFIFKDNGELDTFQGNPLERPKGTFPPCHYGPKECPKVSPDAGLALSERNLMAFQHYKECRAVGHFPDDGIVRENAAIIREFEDHSAKVEQNKTLNEAMLNIMNIVAAGRS